jgi:hypothetical protein
MSAPLGVFRELAAARERVRLLEEALGTKERCIAEVVEVTQRRLAVASRLMSTMAKIEEDAARTAKKKWLHDAALERASAFRSAGERLLVKATR